MGDVGITRRVLLGQLACLASYAQSDDDPLRQLRPAHPRLILLDSDLDKLKILIRDNPIAHRVYLDLEKESDRLLTVPISEYKLIGPRLRAQTRRVLDRVSTLALMYRLTQRDPYQKRALAELRAAANFRDWNPAVFPDTADLAHAFALGYDWLYNSLSNDERSWIRDAVVSKALDPVIPIYAREGGWPRDHFNANMICNAGMGLAALAIAGDTVNPADQSINDKCSTVLRQVFESIPHGLATYGVEGSWPEGMAYWESVTRYVCAFFSALQTALGNDYGLSAFHGVDRAGRYRIHMTGPTGKVFNFADSPEDIGLSPELFWMAKRFSTPAVCLERAEITRPRQRIPTPTISPGSIRERQGAAAANSTVATGRDFPRAGYRVLQKRVGRSERDLSGGEGRRQQRSACASRSGKFRARRRRYPLGRRSGHRRLRSSRLLRQPPALVLLPDPHRISQHSSV